MKKKWFLTLVGFFLVLNQVAFQAAYGAEGSLDPLTALSQAGWVVRGVLLLLLVLSILSWAVGISKFLLFRRQQSINKLFNEQFWSAESLDLLLKRVSDEGSIYYDSSQARVFVVACRELEKLVEDEQARRARSSHRGDSKGDSNSDESTEERKPLVLQPSGLENIERSIRNAVDTEIASFESRLGILATTGSTGPFIGLFGTVWGIMSSFNRIGQTGSASLAAVAPGISEALVATAIGLVVAIPAVVMYNSCLGKIKKEEISLNNFSVDFVNTIKRRFF